MLKNLTSYFSMLVFFTYRKVFNMKSIEILVIIKRILINRFRKTRNWKPLELNLIICKHYSIFRCNFIRIAAMKQR